MNAIDLLKADHERVKAILAQLSESTSRGIKKRTDLLAKLEMEISIHTRLEEEILYPAYKQAGGKEQAEMYYEAKEEHRTVDSLVLPDLKNTDPSTPEFAGRDVPSSKKTAGQSDAGVVGRADGGHEGAV
jgi:hypothetical protein